MAENSRERDKTVKRASTMSTQRHTLEEHSITTFEIVFIIISVSSYVTDLATDWLVVIEYWHKHQWIWVLGSLSLILLSSIIVQTFSLRWLKVDGAFGISYWISHALLSGVLHRYIVLLKKSVSFKECFNKQQENTFKTEKSELNLLHLFHSFLESAPQVILQIYSLIVFNSMLSLRAISVTVSLISIIWSGLIYINDNMQMSQKRKWPSCVLKSVWFFSMVTARLASILLFTVVFGLWTLVPLGIHWAAMTVWIISQKTTFCPTKLDELLYNIVVGFIYCFCYFNLKEGHTRFRILIFYSIVLAQNFASIFLFIVVADTTTKLQAWAVTFMIIVIGGTVSGVTSMLMYYRLFHPNGPIKWNNSIVDEEKNNVEIAKSNENGDKRGNSDLNVRTLKTKNTLCEIGPEIENTDQKLLLDHWIARSGTPTFISAPIVSNSSLDSSGIEVFTVENTPQNNLSSTSSLQKLHGIKTLLHASQNDLNLKQSDIDISLEDKFGSNLTLQKRRGICSSDELKDTDDGKELEKPEKQKSIDRGSEVSHDTDSSNKKTSSGSIDLDLDLSFSDVNSSDINIFNENIVQKLCLSTLKNIKDGNQDADIQNIQKIALEILKEMYSKKGKKKADILNRDVETPSEVLSVHDYENICAVNIAREAWGLRSWNGYSDIENWLHDGSVFRERINETLTSASSEISSCISQELRNYILSAPPVPMRKSHTYSNVLVKHNTDDYIDPIYVSKNESKVDADLFIAKPCLVDNSNQLEPIIEEIDDLGDFEATFKPRLNSESSLVATIDEIRKSTITNSPRNVYHRRDTFWDSPQLNTPDSNKLETNLQKALWKEPSKHALTNTLPYSDELSLSKMHKSSKFAPLTRINSIENENKRASSKENFPCKIINEVPDIIVNNKTDDLTSLDIEYLSHLVSESNIPFRLNSLEDLHNNDITSSLKSLVATSDVEQSKVNNQHNRLVKKFNKNRPRRKFSLLREKFESNQNNEIDKQAIHHSDYVKMNFEPKCKEETSNKKGDNCHVRLSVEKDDLSLESCISSDLRDKRAIFLKQVLNPSKIATSNKKT